MILHEKLKEQGWYLTEEGLKKLTEDDETKDIEKIISLALNYDLKDIAAGALPSKSECSGTISGCIVLQLQKMRNLSAPKSNEESVSAPRFLQLELTDGLNTIVGLEFERIGSLNLNIPPGTKLFIKTEKLKLLNGFLVLKASDIQILGGKVESLVEKWELARQMLRYAKGNRRLSGSGGPPPWIAFGKRVDSLKDGITADKHFKSLQAANEKEKNSKENDEFNASRSQAIAEAAKAGQKKVFGGGQQNILDHNVKKILEKGYSEDEAKQALKATNNNLERSLYNLKRRNNTKSGLSENVAKPASVSAGRTRDKGGMVSCKEESASTKPQSNVSLFDFLTDKLPPGLSSSTAEPFVTVNNKGNNINTKDINLTRNSNKEANHVSNKFENNISSSFAANRAFVKSKSEDRHIKNSRSSAINRKQDENYQPTGSKTTKYGERNNSSRTKTQTANYNKIQNQIPPPHEESSNVSWGNNVKKNERPFKKEKEQAHRNSQREYQSNKRANDNNKTTEKKCYQTRDINRNQDSRSKSNNYPQKQNKKFNNIENTMDNLVDNTLKLSIQNKKEISSNATRCRNYQQTAGGNNEQMFAQEQQKPEYQPNNSQSISTKSFQQNTTLATYSPQGNGFAYDPSKIIGFQSKEANEYAMNMLKSQGMSTQQLQNQTVSSSAQMTAPLPILHQHPENPAVNNQAVASIAYMTQNPKMFVAPSQSMQPQLCMMSAENWPWKEGDLCLAKYWDDGNYYNAKITAISDKTCVVLFLGYGNYEEVLKSDCVPLTDTQQLPLNTHQSFISHSSISQESPQSIQQRSNIQSNVGTQRYRGDREMYVPPAKRNNN